MNVHDILAILGGVVTAGMVVPYLWDIAKDKTQPNVVSWLTWSLLMVIGTIATISEGSYSTAILMGASALVNGAVAVLGIKKGTFKFTRFDTMCLLTALAGIVLWQLTQHAAIAIVIVIATDFTAALPTFRQAWRIPHNETWVTFAGASGGSLLTILSLTQFNFTSLGYPLYWAIASGMIAAIIVARRRVVSHPNSVKIEPEFD